MSSLTNQIGNIAQGSGMAQAVRKSSEVEQIEQRVREHISSVQNAIDHLSGILTTLRGERETGCEVSPPRAVRSGLIGEIEREQADLTDRLLASLANSALTPNHHAGHARLYYRGL